MTAACTIGVIGAGNMGGGLIRGLVSAGRIPAAQITAVDRCESALRSLRELGVQTSCDPLDAVRHHQVVILGVKPQNASQVLQAIGPHLEPDQVLVSLLAGVSTASVENQLKLPIPVVRVMPQVLVQVGAAASGLCPGRYATQDHVQLVQELFDQVGTTVVVVELQMDAVTGLSGSGPAYVYTFIEALADGGVRMGLGREMAVKLAAQTVLGAARMVLETGQHPAALKDQVTSPGGTTIAGLQALEDRAFRGALIRAVQVATERSIELGKAADSAPEPPRTVLQRLFSKEGRGQI